jgi:3-deoxy-D-manno-octulosonic-acid transferase
MAGVYSLYSALLAVLLLLSLPWWLLQMARLGKYRAGLAERLGVVPGRIRKAAASDACVVWIHAVSVGEVLAIVPIVAELRARGYRVVVSTTTHTGQRLARDRFGETNVFYFPLDLGVCIRPYFRALRPRLVVLAETEFWPNFLRLARASGANLAVVNARISDRSFPRYRRWRRLLLTALGPVELFLAQSEQDAVRLREIGAAPNCVEVAGNLKFDAAEPAESEAVSRLGEHLRAAGGPIVVAGSTVEGEEEHVLRAFRAVREAHPAAVLVLAPRHRERFEVVARFLDEQRWNWARRSAFELNVRSGRLESVSPSEPGAASGEHERAIATATTPLLPKEGRNGAPATVRGGVLLLDSLGELAAVYRYADLAFVGGSLAPRGGHNILEPAFFARAIVTGPHMENFRDIVSCFERGQAVVRCDAEHLPDVCLRLLRDDAERTELGRRAQQVLAAERGATARSVERLMQLVNREQA